MEWLIAVGAVLVWALLTVVLKALGREVERQRDQWMQG